MSSTTKIELIHQNNYVIIRFLGELDISSAISLCDRIDVAINYFQYNVIDLQVNSEEGNVNALNYFKSKVNSLRKAKKDVKLCTLAISEVNGPAIEMIAMGTEGCRRAYTTTQFAFSESTRKMIGFAIDNVSPHQNYQKELLMKYAVNNHLEKGTVKKIPNESVTFNGRELNNFLNRSVESEKLSSQQAKALNLIDHYEEEFQIQMVR